MLTIGTHMSIAKGIAKTAENVVEMKANTMQIFSRNPRGSNYKTYTKEEIGRFQEIRRKNQFGPLLAHAPYTMNLASDKEKVYEFACTVIREDIARMDALGIENIVFHPGSHTGNYRGREHHGAAGDYDWKRDGNWSEVRALKSNPGRGKTSGADWNLSGYLSCVRRRV